MQTSVKPNNIIVSNMNMNELHFTGQETHRERDRLCSLPRVTARLNGSAESQAVPQFLLSLLSSPKLHKLYFFFFKSSFGWKKERLSKTWIKYCIFNSTWTCEKPCSIHCKQSGRWFSKSYETHVRESASWKISERMDRATILRVSSQINVRLSDKTTMKENQTGQKTVQLKRKLPFIHTICLSETNF